MQENDEVLDLVDANDTVVDTIRRGDMVKLGYKTPRGYVRFVVAFIVNDRDEIWVPIRGLHKSIAPGSADFSAAEHVQSGEIYAESILRAFQEEAGMHADASRLKSLGKLSPSDDKPTFEEVFAYRVTDDEHPIYSQEEFTSASWLTLPALRETLASGPPPKSALQPAFQLLEQYFAAAAN